MSRSLQTFRRRVLPPSIMSTSAHGETLNALATDGHADHGLSRTGDRVDACLAFPRAAPCPGLYYRRKMNASIGISGKASGGVRLRASATTAWLWVSEQAQAASTLAAPVTTMMQLSALPASSAASSSESMAPPRQKSKSFERLQAGRSRNNVQV